MNAEASLSFHIRTLKSLHTRCWLIRQEYWHCIAFQLMFSCAESRFIYLSSISYFKSSYANAVDARHRFDPGLISTVIFQLKGIFDASNTLTGMIRLLASDWFDSPLRLVHRSLLEFDQMILDDVNVAFGWVHFLVINQSGSLYSSGKFIILYKVWPHCSSLTQHEK